MLRGFLVLIAALLLAPGAALAQDFPKLTGRVVDAANVIPPAAEARLTGKLAALEQQSHRQLVIATIPDLDGYDIADYGYKLGRHWGIGSKARNDGALLIVAPKERKLRIEVGYGLEGTLTDGLSSVIIRETIVPHFKQDDIPGGIEAGTDAIVRQLTLPPAEAERIAAQADKDEDAFWPLVFIFTGLIVFVVVVMWLQSKLRRLGAAYPDSWWGSVGSWLGGGSSGGSGGGGFSGGGGSFGGGGASGSW